MQIKLTSRIQFEENAYSIVMGISLYVMTPKHLDRQKCWTLIALLTDARVITLGQRT